MPSSCTARVPWHPFRSAKGAIRSCVLAVPCLLAFAHAGGASLPFAGLNDIRGPYEGTGSAGEVLYVCRIGDAGKWPICAYWSSARQESSPVLGFGWCIPALESKFVRLDERRWVFHQPDGFARVFVPASRGNKSELTGGTAWTASIKSGDTIRVTADPHDGGPKSEFTFQQGRLIRMVCEEGDFDIKYNGRVAEQITSRGKPVLEVVRKAEEDGQSSAIIRFNDGKSQAAAKCRTVTVFALQGDGSPVEARPEKCLVSLAPAEGRTVEFAYGGTQEEASFSAGGERWGWNPVSRKITSHGGYIYMVAEPKNEWDEPAITRGSPDGRREYHSYDRKNGLREQIMPDGSRREYWMFTSGPFAWRRARRMRITAADGTASTTKFTYNEAGRLVYQRTKREGEGGSTEELWFNDDGVPVRRRLNEEEVPVE